MSVLGKHTPIYQAGCWCAPHFATARLDAKVVFLFFFKNLNLNRKRARLVSGKKKVAGRVAAKLGNDLEVAAALVVRVVDCHYRDLFVQVFL